MQQQTDPMSVVIQGEQVHIDARRKAHHSQYDWIVWRGRDSIKRASRISPDAVKQAMLAMGTQGFFTLYERRTGTPLTIRWQIASIYYARLRRGMYF